MDARRILLCIDDGTRRRLFAAALAPSSDIEVVATGAADESGIRAAAARQPDVILVEAARPGLDGAKVVGRLRAVAPRAAVLAVALHDDRPRTMLARGLAADRYVDPDVSTARLLDVLLEFVRDLREGRSAS